MKTVQGYGIGEAAEIFDGTITELPDPKAEK